MRLLLIDNYDSFTYNLIGLLRDLDISSFTVCKNDEIKLEEALDHDKILISPGPGLPSEAGICLELIRQLGSANSLLGICLGHQAIAEAFGGRLARLHRVKHGIQLSVKVLDNESGLFDGMGPVFPGGLYHSWSVQKEELPACLQVTAISPGGLIMGLRHKTLDIQGLQFHPESIMTPGGIQLISNWVSLSR